MLLERADVISENPDNRGRTPLSYAAHGGNKAVVKLLLGREEVNPDYPDNDGRTPLSYAAEGVFWRGIGVYAQVVKMLLERADVISEKPDNRGRTPLSYAAHAGNEEVVTILLGRQVLNLDTLVNNL